MYSGFSLTRRTAVEFFPESEDFRRRREPQCTKLVKNWYISIWAGEFPTNFLELTIAQENQLPCPII
jgi:hypothetical protein